MATVSFFRFLAGEVTRRQVFDFVMKKMIKQGKPSITKDGGCVYRSSDGCRCGIGHIITNDELKLLENLLDESPDHINITPVCELQHVMRKNNYVIKSNTTFEDACFLSGIQNAHDQASDSKSSKQFIREFEKNMKRIEREYL